MCCAIFSKLHTILIPGADDLTLGLIKGHTLCIKPAVTVYPTDVVENDGKKYPDQGNLKEGNKPFPT